MKSWKTIAIYGFAAMIFIWGALEAHQWNTERRLAKTLAGQEE